mmetsp:Transcript_16923/g.22360  ORF Transcript_16923/g.22360 Transcript_16923/m.22360 type:complete len:90 (+) Transcript_16923:448-717(+)
MHTGHRSTLLCLRMIQTLLLHLMRTRKTGEIGLEGERGSLIMVGRGVGEDLVLAESSAPVICAGRKGISRGTVQKRQSLEQEIGSSLGD